MTRIFKTVRTYRGWTQHAGLPLMALVRARSIHGRVAAERNAAQSQPVDSVHAGARCRQGDRCVIFCICTLFDFGASGLRLK